MGVQCDPQNFISETWYDWGGDPLLSVGEFIERMKNMPYETFFVDTSTSAEMEKSQKVVSYHEQDTLFGICL